MCHAKKRLILGCGFLFCLQPTCTLTRLSAQMVTIRISVLDGHTGRALTGQDLGFVDYHPNDNERPPGDLNGRATVTTVTDGNLYKAIVFYHGVLVFNILGAGYAWTPCSRQKFFDSATGKYGQDHLYPVATIAASGLVTHNDCGKGTAVPKPGELVLFLQRTTWWERFVAGMRS